MSTRPDAEQALENLIADLGRTIEPDVLSRAAAVDLLLLDVDGVMTDGGLIQSDDGQEHKRFHARDTLGLRMLQASGTGVAIVSGRRSPTLSNRARELGIDTLYQDCHDKVGALEEIAAASGVPLDRCAFVGDDVVDLPPMSRVGLALCPADAHPLVRACADHVLPRGGGEAALRDACELLMHARGTLREALADYLPGR